MVNVTRAFFNDPVINLARQGTQTPGRRSAVRDIDFSSSDNQKKILEQTKKNIAIEEQRRRLAEAKERQFKRDQRRVMMNDARVAMSGFRDKTLQEVGAAAGVASGGQSFSPEQEALRQTFGGGEKIWGINQQPVTLHNDLNPSRSNPYNETASMFGFGLRNERSGLF